MLFSIQKGSKRNWNLEYFCAKMKSRFDTWGNVGKWKMFRPFLWKTAASFLNPLLSCISMDAKHHFVSRNKGNNGVWSPSYHHQSKQEAMRSVTSQWCGCYEPMLLVYQKIRLHVRHLKVFLKKKQLWMQSFVNMLMWTLQGRAFAAQDRSWTLSAHYCKTNVGCLSLSLGTLWLC